MSNPKPRLLVEGPEDRNVLSVFCNEHIGDRVVEVTHAGGARTLLSADYLRVHMKASGFPPLAVVADADYTDSGSPRDRWSGVRDLLTNLGYQDVPKLLPASGVHMQRRDLLPKFSFWLMPDNCSAGYLESFLWSAVGADGDGFPDKAALESHIAGLPDTLRKFSEIQHHKAILRTWLCWSKQPGMNTGDSVRRYFSSSTAEPVRSFVQWLKIAFC